MIAGEMGCFVLGMGLSVPLTANSFPGHRSHGFRQSPEVVVVIEVAYCVR
jgi:hypothetical protein